MLRAVLLVGWSTIEVVAVVAHIFGKHNPVSMPASGCKLVPVQNFLLEHDSCSGSCDLSLSIFVEPLIVKSLTYLPGHSVRFEVKFDVDTARSNLFGAKIRRHWQFWV